jgi:Flp pilus assembly protein TadG
MRGIAADEGRSAGASWRGLLARFCRDQAGGYLIVAGLSLPALLGIVSLGTDAGLWYYKHQAMQGAADSGALAAAVDYYLESNDSVLKVQAQSVIARYGFIDGSNGVTVAVNRPPSSGTHTGTSSAVEVIVSQPQIGLLSRLWHSQSVVISARAVAMGTGGKGCVFALDRSALRAVDLQGTAQVVLNGCSLIDDSNNSIALNVGGSATLSALSVSSSGGVSGTASITTSQGIATGQPPFSDPYAGTSVPSFSGCAQHNFSAKTAVTIDPGVYCGGMTLNAGANVTLNPGVYYLDQGNLQVNGGATMTGSGVTLVFTSSNGHNYANATINGGATVDLSAPSSGPTVGMVMFGDPSMTAGTAFKFEGGASQTLAGAVYLPEGSVSFAGGANTTTGCTQLIADTITFVGNSNFAINCQGVGTKPLGSALATLVE